MRFISAADWRATRVMAPLGLARESDPSPELRAQQGLPQELQQARASDPLRVRAPEQAQPLESARARQPARPLRQVLPSSMPVRRLASHGKR